MTSSRPKLPDLGWLHRERTPRVHPNGFVQVDLTKRVRLHVWHPGNPYRQRTYHPVHDHVFHFRSWVYSGRLVNAVYWSQVHGEGTHVLYTARCTGGEESALAPTPDRVRLVAEYAEVLQPGESYFMPARRFHETLANEPTLTIIEKSGPTAAQGSREQPRVAVPVGVRPDNDFRRDAVDPDVVWRLVEEAYP